MKKTLAAVAVLGAFAGSALAADVTLYGRVDAGLNFTSTSYDNVIEDGEEVKDNDSFSLKSGQYTGSRWGIKGAEQISENLTVGFQLENGFTVDDGKIAQNGGIFGREARLYAKTQFGEFGFGRMGGLDSGSGSYDLVGGYSAWSTGWGGYTGNMGQFFLGKSDRYDNMITYKSPEFAGLTVLAQVSLKENSSDAGEESKHLTNRYYAIGARANYGAFQGALVYSMQDYANVDEKLWVKDGEAVNYNDDDGHTVTAWGSYDFGVAKVSLAGQYFDNVAQVRSRTVSDDWVNGEWTKDVVDYDVDYGMTGYGILLAAEAPLGGGNLYGHVGYADAEQSVAFGDDKEDTYEAWGVSIGYDYALSKRTKLYAAASYTQFTDNDEEVGSKDEETKVTEVMVGMAHYF